MPRRTMWQEDLGIWIEQHPDGRWAVSGSSPRVWVADIDEDGQLVGTEAIAEPESPQLTKLDLLGLISYHVRGYERCFKPDTGEPTNHGAPMGQFVVDCLSERFDPTLSRTDIERLLISDMTDAIEQLNQVVGVLQSGEAISRRRRRTALCLLGHDRNRITVRCEGCNHFPGVAEARGWDTCELPWDDDLEIGDNA